jgi:hypothetical protein
MSWARRLPARQSFRPGVMTLAGPIATAEPLPGIVAATDRTQPTVIT